MGAVHDVDMVIVNWNDQASTKRTVDALRADRPRRMRRIIIVDNGSTDGSAQAFGSWPGVETVPLDENLGFGRGVNAALAMTSAPVVVLVNNDARPRPGFTDAIVGALERGDADVAAVAARVVLAGTFVAAETPQDDDLVGADGTRWRRAGDDPRGVALLNSTGTVVTRSGNGLDRDWLAPLSTVSEPEVFGFSGGAVALRRSAIEAVGGFDDELFMYFEDTELSWRLRRRGWRIVHEPSAIVDHDHARSAGLGSAFFVEHNVRNRLFVATVHGPLRMVVAAWARALANALAATARRAGGGAVAARWRGIAGAARSTPSALHKRRLVDRSATVRRWELLRFLVR